MKAHDTNSVIVVGAGGHAKVVVSTLLAAGYRVDTVLDDSPAKWGSTVLGCVVTGPIEKLAEAVCRPAVIAIGDNQTRYAIATRYSSVVRWVTVIHPTAYVDSSAQLGHGTVVFAGAIVQPDCRIGNHVIINTGATIDHDCTVHDYGHVAPGAHLAGGVELGQGSLCGIGSCVVPGRRVGQWAIIGAGGVVVNDVRDGDVVVGVPAKSLSKLQ